MTANERPRALGDAQISQFIRDGFVRIDNAFPRELADQARAILWRDLPCSAHDPSTWTRPVIRLPGYGDSPFREAINTPALHAAFDEIVGDWSGQTATIRRSRSQSVLRSEGREVGDVARFRCRGASRCVTRVVMSLALRGREK
jgi:hypothetical protein